MIRCLYSHPPRLISWIEGTAIGTVAPFLPEGWETVGTTFDLAHLAATPVGMKVRVVTEVTEVKGKMLTYSVKAYDEVDKICEGHTWPCHHRAG